MKNSRMKKYAVIGLSLLAILVIGVSIAVAQEPADDDTPAAPGTNFVDEDGDGVCDLMSTGAGDYGQGQGYGATGQGAGGANFVDEDNDGVCDLMGTDAAGNSYGQGAGGVNFVDEDNDGVCDLMGTSQGSGLQGQAGNGFRGGAGNGHSQGNGMGQGARGATATQ